MNAPPFELELIVRLLLAALVGAVVGLEREIHGHPAGLRTHLLVAVGSAVFTILSFHGFAGLGGAAFDPTRIAAQVVSGIGFLGAGAIIKEGFTVRGLTTAASLWGTSALGMATALGEYALAGSGAAIILVSLWPLRPIADRLEGIRGSTAKLQLESGGLEVIGRVRTVLEQAGLEVGSFRTRRIADTRYAVQVGIRHAGTASLYTAVAAVSSIEGVDVTSVEQGD